MVLRKHPSRVFPLEDFVAKGIVTARQRERLETALHARRTIVISGSTGSAKTSLTNALLHALQGTDRRIVILEDDAELVCTAPDVSFQRCVPVDGPTPPITMRDLCKDLLRLSPDLIVIGEFRDGAALDAMKAFSTGHQGLCTVHSDSAEGALLRLEQLILEVSATPQQPLIGESVDLIVHMERYGLLWRITGMLQVEGWDGRQYCTRAVL
jgi:Flp pilus assembly CpaF family ATPase